MFGIARIAIAAVSVVTAGTGSAVLVATNSPPVTATSAASLTASANADLAAATQAHDAAAAALASTGADAQAKADALLEASTTKLEQASVDMKAAVDAGSQTAVDGIATFTAQSTQLVNRLATAAAGTANASVEASARLGKAVDAQLAAARSVATASGSAAVKALTETKVALPQISVPQTSANAQVSAGAQSNTTASAPSANVVSSTTGQLGINLGR